MPATAKVTGGSFSKPNSRPVGNTHSAVYTLYTKWHIECIATAPDTDKDLPHLPDGDFFERLSQIGAHMRCLHLVTPPR